jgi:8-oxo-dGTP pyrophosphatase MutT (NUDIX family)
MSMTIKAGGGVVVNEKGQLLMIFRRKKWDLPKGKLDPDETIAHCALREVMEETGLHSLQLQKELITTHHQYLENNVVVNKETYWFLMHAPSNQALIPQTEEDIEKIEWVNKSELHLYLEESYPTIRQVLSLL